MYFGIQIVGLNTCTFSFIIFRNKSQEKINMLCFNIKKKVVRNVTSIWWLEFGIRIAGSNIGICIWYYYIF